MNAVAELKKRLAQAKTLEKQVETMRREIEARLAAEIAAEKGLIAGNWYRVSERGARALKGRITCIGDSVWSDGDISAHIHFYTNKGLFVGARWVHTMNAAFVPEEAK